MIYAAKTHIFPNSSYFCPYVSDIHYYIKIRYGKTNFDSY